MGRIIRTPTKAKGGITPDERERMAKHSELWISRAMRTGRCDRAALASAIKGLYAAANLREPRIVIVPSPLVMAYAYGIAFQWWAERAATRAATYDATAVATHAATAAATRTATRAATAAATVAATATATYDATRAATFDATHGATHAATFGATYDATRAATRSYWIAELAQEYCSDASAAYESMREWWRAYQGGNMWAAWDCYLTAARDILGLRLAPHAGYAHWEQAAIHGGFRVLHPEFCIVSDYPDVLLIDEQRRPHCDTGPSHRWSDGWSLYHVHGVRVTQQVVEAPETLTLAQIQGEQNAEVRRVMIERFGVGRYVSESGAKAIHEDRYGILYYLPEAPFLAVRVTNGSPEPDGTRRQFWLRVDRELRPLLPNGELGEPQKLTAANAVASTYGLRGAEYAPSVRT